MPRLDKFTDRAISALRPESRRYEVSEKNTRGLWLRVSPSGVKTFYFRYRYRGKNKGMMLGSYGAVTEPGKISLAKAHKLHADARALLKEGKDPADLKQSKIAEEKRAGTISQLADEYIERHAKRKNKSWREYQRMLNKDVLPTWGTRKAKDVTRRDVVLLLDDIEDRVAQKEGNASAGRSIRDHTLTVISSMFRFGIRRGIVDASPCIEIGRDKSTPRARVLEPDEIKAVWRKLDKAKTAELIRLAIKLLLVTGQRRGELAKAKWADIDLPNKIWSIPIENSKNGHPHAVPLSNMAVGLFKEIRSLEHGKEYLFPSPYGDGPITERAVTRAVANNRDVFGIAHWTPHDLRRTVATGMNRLAIPREHIERVLNHLPPKIVRVYDRHDYQPEMRAALQFWATELERILAND